MSLSQFSDAMKTRALLSDTSSVSNPALIAEMDAMYRAIGTSYDPTSNTLLNSASMVLAGTIVTAQKDNPAKGRVKGQAYISGQSMFRKQGMDQPNTVFLVTENNLKIQFDILELYNPILNGVVVTPGAETVRDASNNIVRAGLLEAYIVWLHQHDKTANIEYYTDTHQVGGLWDNGRITSIRQREIAHTSTNVQMYKFLQACGLKDTEAEYRAKFQIGHIEAQSHGKLSIPVANSNDPAFQNGIFKELIELNQYLDIVSSSLLPQYSAVTAAIFKDFTGSEIFMTVEMQPAGIRFDPTKDPFTNQGSGMLSHALAFSGLTAEMFTQLDPKNPNVRQVIKDNDLIADKLAELYKNFIANKAIVENALANFQNLPANYLLNLESSDSIRTFIVENIKSVLSSKPAKKLKIQHTQVPVLKIDNSKSKALSNSIKQLSKSIKASIKVLEAENTKKSSGKKAAGPAARLRSTGGQFTSLVSLQNIINQTLHAQIQANMGTGSSKNILNYRTGRLAESAKVEGMNQSREGMITAFYSYMRNPYGTFSTGGAQESPVTRDPKLLISKSIREIGATMVNNRMRAVLV